MLFYISNAIFHIKSIFIFWITKKGYLNYFHLINFTWIRISYVYKVGLCSPHTIPRHQRKWGVFGHLTARDWLSLLFTRSSFFWRGCLFFNQRFLKLCLKIDVVGPTLQSTRITFFVVSANPKHWIAINVTHYLNTETKSLRFTINFFNPSLPLPSLPLGHL